MVKKVVNIGVEGNDASGDPIREAFAKVNDNFNELYTFVGRGDGISITALEEGPDDIIPNSILILNDAGNQYLSKTLRGDGITIDNTDPNEIVLTTASFRLSSDENPSLSNDLDATNQSIYRLATPTQSIADSIGVNLDTFAINKGYADGTFVKKAGDTMTGFLNVPSGASGTQVARAEETLLREGGFTSQMQGPLILQKEIEDTDDPLTAATKEYVEVSSYTSTIELYVSTTGDDNLFNIPERLKGRSWAYAFQSLGAACRYAERLVNSSDITLGVTLKDITYNDYTTTSTVVEVIPLSGDFFTLSITNNSTATDPRAEDDIRPGQVIRGKTSGAVVRIDQLLASYAGYEHYKVFYENNSDLTFIVGEEVEYGNPIHDLNITIFMESGNFYEHYPIRVPDNVTIHGSEFRRTIIRPKKGRSASVATDLFFRRDPLFDTDLEVTDRLYGWHYLTDTTRPQYSGTLTNPGLFQKASDLIIRNKQFIIEEVIGYINGFPIGGKIGLFYDEDKCYRDTGFILDALSYDFALNTNFASLAAARAYYRGTQAGAVLGSDKVATLDSLSYLEQTLLDLVSNSVTKQRISDRIALMVNIIDNGYEEDSVEITWPVPSSIDLGFLNGRSLLISNIDYIIAQVRAYIDYQIANASPTSIWNGLDINGDKCARDVKHILQAVIHDLTYGGNWQSRDAATAYFLANSAIIASNEIEPTLATYEYLKDVVYAVITNGVVDSYQNDLPRVGGTPGTTLAGNTAKNLIEIIRYALDNNGVLSGVLTYPSLTSVDTAIETDFNQVDSNKTSLQDQVITYINNTYFIYDETLCRRDLGLVINSIAYDLIYGSYTKVLEASNAYFSNASGIESITTQLDKTVGGFNRLRDVIKNVISNEDVTSYQNAYPTSLNIDQYKNTSAPGESGSETAVDDLIDFMINVVSQDSSFNTPKDNEVLDVFLLNEATIIRDLSCQEHGGFMGVLDPLGQILTKSPYVHIASSFSRSTNKRQFAGGLFVDAFAGNIPARITQRYSDVEIQVSGLDIRLPLLPCAFYVRGVRFNVISINDYDPIATTATIIISPSTPDDPTYTEDFGALDSTRLFMPSTEIEFLSAGNNSMLANDFTNLNDLGYGLVAVNGGLLEAVSVFTYYCHISYFADTGGQIRSVTGSSSHGAFGLVAKGAFPLEIPDAVYLLEDMVVGARIYSPWDYYNDQGGTNLSGTGIGATFDITVDDTSYIVTISNGGSGYIVSNQIIVLGNEFGGIAGVNDLTITVTGIGGGGSINSISASGIIPENAPVNQYYNRAGDVTLYMDTLTNDFQLPNGCELEVAAGTAPNRLIYRYLINNVQPVNDPGVPEVTTGTLYRLNLANGGLGVGTTGIKYAIDNNEPITIRMNTSILLYDINKETATRPSTALVFDEAPLYVNRIIAISNVGAKVGSFSWSDDVATCVSEAHGLTNTIPKTEIYLVFLGGTFGNPSRGYYIVDNVIDANTFTVITSTTTEIYSEGTISWGAADGEVEAQMKEPFRSTNITVYYDSVSNLTQPFTVTIIRSFSSTNEFSALSTAPLLDGQAIKFTGAIGGVIPGTIYYVKNVTNFTNFTISETEGGSVKTLIDNIGNMYGSVDPAGFRTWGVTGSHKVAIRALTEYEVFRINNAIDVDRKMLLGWRGKVHQITGYVSPEDNGTDYAVLEIDDLAGDGFAEPLGPLEGGWYSAPNVKANIPADSPGNVTIQISTVRATGHDFLEVGTGSYASSNFPNVIFGYPERAPDQAAEVIEITKGRVFYATTDQDGNFRIGTFFKVDQGTGTVTFSSSIAISNLDGLGFKRGVAIAEFSVDDSFFDNATDIVPTQQSIRSYIDRRLGLTHSGAVINPASGRLIPDSTSGFMSLGGQLSMRANMNLGSFRITNLAAPLSGSDGATKDYADTKLSLSGGTMFGYITLHANPTNGFHAATKQYVDSVAAAQNELRELSGVSLPDPITTIAGDSLFVFNGTNFTWGAQAGDVIFTLSGNTLTSAIQSGVIVDADVSASAAISQSKLNLADATANTTSGISVKGVASFDSAYFNTSSGWVGLKANGITPDRIQQIGSKTVLGNSSGLTGDVAAVTFETVVQGGGGLYQSLFTTNGVVTRTGATTFTTTAAESAATANAIVQRDSLGGFSAVTINATTQLNIGGNKALGNSGTSPNQYLEFYSPQGNLFLSSRSGTTTVAGSWVLGSGATLESTYAADIAEYYQGDKVYDPGTVLMIGGEFDVVLAAGAGTTKVAGVVSTEAAYIMNGSCPGEKNLIALQGRVPCKVVGKVEKGDLMVVGIVPGVAMASADPKPGSIIGKALQNYDSDHVGMIEVMVGKH